MRESFEAFKKWFTSEYPNAVVPVEQMWDFKFLQKAFHAGYETGKN